MTTLREKLDQKWAEGCEAFIDIVHAKVGNARINGDESSVYYVELVHRARRLLLDLGELRGDLLDFGSLSATGPSPEERERQRQLTLDDANAAAIAREKAGEKEGAAELEAVERQLGTELDRVLGSGEAVHAQAERGEDGRVMVSTGTPYGTVENEWEITREAPRVLGALRQLPDGSGAEAVRAILCGLAETPATEDDTDADNDRDGTPDNINPEGSQVGDTDGDDCDQVEQSIGAELARCGAASITVGCDGPGRLISHLTGSSWGYDGLAAEALEALRALPDGCGEDAVRERLLHGPVLPGRPAGEPAKRRARKAKGEAGE